jgi:hypothetical protein
VSEDDSSQHGGSSTELIRLGDLVLACGGAGLFVGAIAWLVASEVAGLPTAASLVIGIGAGIVTAGMIATSARVQKLIVEVFSSVTW